MDSFEKIKNLVENYDLYPPEIIVNLRKYNTHWETDNWRMREWYVRHLMVCMYLGNCEPNENIAEILKIRTRQQMELLEIEERMREEPAAYEEVPYEEEGDVSESGGDSSIEEEQDSIPEDEHLGSGSESEDENVQAREIFMAAGDQTLYRYILIETLPAVLQTQSFIASSLGLNVPMRQFDLVDLTEKKFIEIKVSEEVNHHNNLYSRYSNPNTVLTMVSPLTGEIVHSINKRDPYPGEEKVRNFLLRRKEIMAQLQIHDEAHTYNISMEKFVFRDGPMNQYLDEFRRIYLEGADQKTRFTVSNTDPIIRITMSTLFTHLEKPILWKEDPVRYAGKILPSPYKKWDRACEKDVDTIDNFFNENCDGWEIVRGESFLFDFFNWVLEEWDSNTEENRNFNLMQIKRNTAIPEILTRALGVNYKKIKQEKKSETYKQLETKPLTRKGYHKWIERLYEDLVVEHNLSFKMTTPDLINNEEVPFYRDLEVGVNVVMNAVSKRWIGAMINENENLFSRLSMSYNLSNKTHSSIAIMPLVITGREDDVTNRLHSGILIRGPQHTRDATDRINIVTVEMIKDLSLVDHINEFCLLKQRDQERYLLIRKNAIKKVDGTFLAFNYLSLFMPLNLLGDLVFNSEGENRPESMMERLKQLITDKNSLNFILDRIIDSVLMSTLGNSRDEGYFSMLRKLFMILLDKRRGNHSYSINIEEFCEKVNECLIDNPLSMFKHNTIMYVIAKYAVAGP